MNRTDTDDYRALFLRGLPLMDVRAPVEFHKGAFPGAENLPLMNDAERHEVGVCYKRQGPEAAVALGHRLVSGHTKAQRIGAWVDFAAAHPQGYLYCFRGGHRSRIAQEWLQAETGVRYPRVLGGYKAMRNFLMQTLEHALADSGFTVLGGMTGTGKTEVLAQLDHALDLEGHAHHRGSSFGKRASPQPVQIDFENRLSIDVLRKRAQGHAGFVVEDESRLIGGCSLPLALYHDMQHRPLVWLEDTLENRVRRIARDYVVDLCAEFEALHGEEQGFELFGERLRQSLDNIRRRLGGERHARLAAIMDEALAAQARSGEIEPHYGWIEGLLKEYYDPMYTYQREQKASRIVFAGDLPAVLDYFRGACPPAKAQASRLAL
ncbi:tRNA 2-selenouridine(34) synthase MnmH [Pusillimonas noertemannii]|uniref:tRNA 2-selenouridine synthase n=1 Tax=Pusillimonas noertemannii TaxID=305977 RepID=A0A2U1CIW3_9BURK|nr:tRNA 2-selenouridine(34) synthase MnmH [Pusillimonas noertemannii]NYT69982.1 tRNA 2-selenouridine(34) synthase MnmH [Pusillimonas noertemannii]PVY60933.1 tRNA 2-selenouridine synthase [Pusillimonas noertemannii]TFL08407.1 tRNA 2-selenouridine(34) synthase MnmH [Pusillimonas noertemannii]